jgi:hypothetical protein
MAFIITREYKSNNKEEIQTDKIEGDIIRIGRGTENEVHLDDLQVSLQHLTIEKTEDGYFLKSLDNANGTYVNGQMVSVCQLANHDEIQVGAYTLHFQVSAADAPVALMVEQTETTALSAAEAKVEYLTKYQLSTSLWTKSRLTLLAVVVLLGGLSAAVAVGKTAWGKRLETVWAPGRLAMPHRFFQHDCAQCHKTVWHNVVHTACQTCHDGPLHHANQPFTPGCATCHLEHRGGQSTLTAIDEHACTQCHADLHTADRSPLQFAQTIRSFTAGHPEFAVHVRLPDQPNPSRVRLSAHASDTAQIKLNHALHLKPDLPGLHGFAQLTCSDCHHLDAQGAYMQPIDYTKHCAACHTLEFDARFPKQTVPHASPKGVHAFLVNTFTQYFLEHLEECEARVQQPLRRRPGHPPTREEAQSLKACADGGVSEAEKLLFDDKTCKECHVLQRIPDEPHPVVVAPAIPQRWLPHSVFNHQVHARAGRTCEDCHTQARTSQHTSDVLLPGIETCQQCHTASGGVRLTCVTCHVYHDNQHAAVGGQLATR